MADRAAADPGRQGSAKTPTGYLHPLYAEAFEEFGRPRFMPSSGGWILEREIPRSSLHDAMGCYPRLVCDDWSALCADVDRLGERLVSLLLVTEAFAPDTDLAACFNRIEPYKTHYVVDLIHSTAREGSRDHRYKARRALRNGVIVERCAEPIELLDDWERLYRCLVARHGITGLKRFSRRSFEKQLSVPGTVAFAARKGSQVVAAQVWYIHGEVAYSHLQATDRSGLDARAPYALYREGLACLAASCSHADLGGVAGNPPRAADGLAQFKRGWASHTRPTHLCQRVFDRSAYAELVQQSGTGRSDYFPAYRAGELD